MSTLARLFHLKNRFNTTSVGILRLALSRFYLILAARCQFFYSKVRKCAILQLLFIFFIDAFHFHQVHSYIRQVPLYNRQVDVYAKHLRISSPTQTIIGKHCFLQKKALLCNGQNSALTKVIFFTSKRKTDFS